MKLRKDKWQLVKLSEVCKTTSGGTPLRQRFDFYNGAIPWLKSGELHTKYVFDSEEKITELGLKNSSAKIFPINTILIALYGVTAGTSAILKTEAATNQAVCGIIPNDHRLDYEFLYNSLNFKKEFIFKKRVGTYQLNISQAVIQNIEFLLPPLEEQKQIASLFQSLETAMEQVEDQKKNLLQLKNNLLQDLFSEKQKFGKHLNETDFETVRFDKVAINISERVEPKKTELTTYVGLEHLDADNLRIERTGTPDDVIGTKLKIYKGDIIFGKRRAYLRKVAVSHFDGIASAHSMILRANEKYIEKDFLPYFMQSEAFMSRAVQISEGSLSPTIKNKTLAQQEFTLPKKEKQKELISIFKQFDLTMDQLKQQTATLKNLKEKLLEEILG
jgi:restriction endonuclease S subunit